METVAFYSYKGGVGRTLLVANTAQFLAMSGRHVVALDLDLEAPGLHQKLGTPDALNRAQAGTLNGAVDVLLHSLENEAGDRSLRQLAVKVDLPVGTKGTLILIPAGSAPSHAYWQALERLNKALRAPHRNGGLLEAVLELQARIADEFAPEFLLVDSRTGITELGGLATSILADRVVCLTTTAPESVEGTRVVADALRTAPRLSSQKPLRLDFLLTRVATRSPASSTISRLKEFLGGELAVLPHDTGIANEERVFLSWLPSHAVDVNATDNIREELFAATLDWIANAFPGHRQDAEMATKRMLAVHDAWQHLTRTSERIGRGVGSRAAWPLHQLRERVRFENGKDFRQADIVAYDRPAGEPAAKPVMIIEYVDREDRDAVASWWLEKTRVPVVAVLSPNSDQRLYSKKHAWDPRPRHSDRWDLPLPHDFEALPDPTDVSIDALLDSVRRGHSEYVERIVAEWVHCSASTLHGGAPWKPRLAKKIVDGLARVEDVEVARRVLWETSAGSHYRRRMWLGDRDEGLDEQVLAELFAPLLWRLPPEASIELMHSKGRHFGPSGGVTALGLLARDILGLRYDPDAMFRVEGQQILDRSPRESDIDYDRGLYGLIPAFRHTEITFEISSDLPPLATREEDNDSREQRKQIELETLIAQRLAAGTLVTTGLLGDYQPKLGHVVLYQRAIARCADKLALRPRHVGSVTLIHETLHALAHLGRDLDGRIWSEFALPSANSLLFEPSWFHETLTQYFTYHHILRLRDPVLLHAFETMSAKQAPAYRTWQRLHNIPIEDARSWFLSVRRGIGTATTPWQALFNSPPADG